KCKAYRIDGVVRNGERRDRDIPNMKAPASRKYFELAQFRTLSDYLPDRPRPCLVRRSSHEDRNVQLPCQNQQPIDVIGVLVCDQDSGKGARIIAPGLHPFESFATGDAADHQNGRARAEDNSAISPAAAGQHRDRNSHSSSIRVATVETGVTFSLSETFEQRRSLAQEFIQSFTPARPAVGACNPSQKSEK